MSTEAPPAPATTPAQPATPPPAATPAADITSNPPPATHVDPPAAPDPATPAPAPTPPADPVVTDNRTTPATDTPPPPPAITADGKLGENWFLTLGDEFAPHAKDLGKHKDIRSLVTELNYFRRNGIEYPGEAAPQQAIDRFRKVAGVPETPEGYGITAENVKLPEGMAFDTELATEVTKAAHKTHAPPAAVAAIVESFNTILAKRTADAQIAETKARQAAQDSLVAEWRGDFQTNASTVRHLTSRLADQAGIAADDPSVSEMANNPAFARIMLQVARLTSEDRVHTPHGFGDLKSPAERIKEITSGKDPIWGERYRNGDVAAYEHVNSLREKARS